ncbi:MAG: hypothetical protein DRP45_11855, partial [Candidatus Zixiibacteriota bacterium]
MLKALRTITIITVVILLGTSLLFAEAPDTVWTRTYGAEYSEVAFAGTATSDDCMVIAGYTSSFGAWNCDGYLVKVNMDGDTAWTKMYGEDYYDYVMDIVETADSGLVIAGKHSFPGSGIRKCWLLKTYADGTLEWEKNFTGADDLETEGLAETADSGFVITGYTGPYGNYDVFLFRTDKNGDSMWVRTYGGDQNDKGLTVLPTDDGGFLIVASSYSFGDGDSDLWVIKTDENGDTLWTRMYGYDANEGIADIEATHDGAFIIASNTILDPPGVGAAYLIKLLDTGDTLWTNTFTTEPSPTICDINETADHGFLLTGGAGYDYPLSGQMLIIKTDANGDTLWTTHCGGNAHDVGRYVYETDAGEIVVAGGYATSSYGDFYAVKLGAPSQTCCIPPSVGDLDQSGGTLGFNYDGSDLTLMIDGLFINPVHGFDAICLDEADIDFSCGRPCSNTMMIDGSDLTMLIDALFINPLHYLPNCDE